MWKHILESSVEELVLPTRQQWTWQRMLVEGVLLLGLIVTGSWLIR